MAESASGDLALDRMATADTVVDAMNTVSHSRKPLTAVQVVPFVTREGRAAALWRIARCYLPSCGVPTMSKQEQKTSLVLIHGSETYVLRYDPDEQGLERALQAVRDWYSNPTTGFDDLDAKCVLMTLASRHGRGAMSETAKTVEG